MPFDPLAGTGLRLFTAFLLVVLVPVGIGIYLYVDAKKRDADHPLAWALAAAIGGTIGAYFPMIVVPAVVLALYLVVRDELGPSAPPAVSESDLGEHGEVLGEPIGTEEPEFEGTGVEESESGSGAVESDASDSGEPNVEDPDADEQGRSTGN